MTFDDIFNKYIDKGSSVVVAVSGGPDSMVLLDCVMKKKDEFNLDIFVAHVNHGLREESNDEEKMVVNFCEKNGLSYNIMTIDNYNKGNIEEQARTKRYRFFDECVKKCKAKYLFTAHHGDDLMETMLMRMVRGSSLRGYAGFKVCQKKNGYDIIRPLIGLTKDEILEYANINNIPYAVDKTNFDDSYTRNRYRKYILPVLKKEDSLVHEKFYKFSNMLNKYDEFVNNIVLNEIGNVYIDGKIDISIFSKLDDFIKIRVIEYVLNDVYGSDITLINDSHVDIIIDMITIGKNRVISLPMEKCAKVSYGMFMVCDSKEICDYYLELDNEVILPNGMKIISYKKDSDNSNFICRLNSSDIKLPLFVRNRKPGDKIYVKGLNGSKKVKDIFIDEKIDIDDRNSWPVVVDSDDNIVWIPGLKKSKFDKQINENYDIIFKYL